MADWRVRAIKAVPLGAACALALAAGELRAQGVDTDVVAASADAFGVSIGVEILGVYGPNQVRGFDPLAAGNARIEGLYADIHGPVIPYGPLPSRLVANTRIRIGPAAAGFPFPSPTGIVDFSLRSPLGPAGVSPTLYVGPYGTSGFDLDAHVPLADNHCGVGGGVTRRWDEFVPDLTQFTSDVAAFAACQDSHGSGFKLFYGRTTETKAAVYPTIYLTAEPTPDPVDARNTAPTWALGSTVLSDYGGLVTLEAPANWTLRAGLFRSVYDQPTQGSDLLYDPDPTTRIATHQYISYADQYTGSTSGELRATHLAGSGPRQHEIILTLRARDVTARYGGDDPVDLGTVVLGDRPAIPEPAFTYGLQTHDHTRQWTAGVAYALHWREVLDIAAGLEPVRYERTVNQPQSAPLELRETPLLYYFSAGVPLSAHSTVYAGLTRGLEDSGLAPASAANRGQLLPVSRTSQEELGLRYTRGATTVIAGVFDVRKPYYNIGGDGFYTWLGTESHTGLELSINAEPVRGLTMVIGAVFMSPKVALGNGVTGVGSAPINQPRDIVQLSGDYRFPAWPRGSIDVIVTHLGAVPVRLDDGADNPAQTLVNIGGRYRFNIAGHAATLRVQIQNVTNQRVWSVVDYSGGLSAYPPLHMAFAYLAADF